MPAQLSLKAEVSLNSSQTIKMEFFLVKIVNGFKTLTIFAKSFKSFTFRSFTFMFDWDLNTPLQDHHYFNYRSTRKRCAICSTLTIKTLERRHQRRSCVFIVNFEYISHLFLVFLLLTLNK